MSQSNEPRVFLVGAGPGAPGLLTLRALELLQAADLIVYDQLVPRRLLDFANPRAEMVCVRELPGNHPDKYPHIHTILQEGAKNGKRVVRLKGGDPLVFGRGGEEAEALRKAGVPYEIVPGVTAALAAAAFLEIPLTHRNYSSAVALITGHELPNKPGNKLDWQVLAKFPGTLAIYMGISRLPLIAEELLKHGLAPDTPAAVVERASTGEMRTVTATLSNIDLARRNAGLESPGLILIGECIQQRPASSWFERLPLCGEHVLVTRPRQQAEAMVRRLETLGAVPYLLSILDILPIEDVATIDHSLTQIRDGEWDWIVFTSAHAVRHLIQRLLATGRDLRDFGKVQFAAVGPKTEEALREFHLRSDVTPSARFSAEELSEQLVPRVRGKRVLLARAKEGRELLLETLSPIATVGEVIVYRQAANIENADSVLDALRRGEIRWVPLTSPNTARGILQKCDETILGRIHRGEIHLVAISSLTANAIREFGLPVAGIAEEASIEGLIACLAKLAASQRAVATDGVPTPSPTNGVDE